MLVKLEKLLARTVVILVPGIRHARVESRTMRYAWVELDTDQCAIAVTSSCPPDSLRAERLPAPVLGGIGSDGLSWT